MVDWECPKSQVRHVLIVSEIIERYGKHSETRGFVYSLIEYQDLRLNWALHKESINWFDGHFPPWLSRGKDIGSRFAIGSAVPDQGHVQVYLKVLVFKVHEIKKHRLLVKTEVYYRVWHLNSLAQHVLMGNKFRALCPILTRSLTLYETLELSYLNQSDTHGCQHHGYNNLVSYLIFLTLLIATCEHWYDLCLYLLPTNPHPNTLAIAINLQPHHLPPLYPIISHNVLPNITMITFKWLPPLK
jgi:hypothetical protein